MEYAFAHVPIRMAEIAGGMVCKLTGRVLLDQHTTAFQDRLADHNFAIGQLLDQRSHQIGVMLVDFGHVEDEDLARHVDGCETYLEIHILDVANNESKKGSCMLQELHLPVVP